MNRKALFVLLLIICPLLAFAHNPLSAKYHLVPGSNASLLSINLSQSGVEQALKQTYGSGKLTGLSTQDWEELIVSYIKENFNLTVDGNRIEIGEGGIKLGAHQTDLKFVLVPLPQDIHKIKIDIPAFKENENHQSIFSYQIGDKSDHAILSKHNDYKSTISVKEGTSTSIANSSASNYSLWGIALVLGTIGFYYSVKKKAMKA